MPLKPRTLSVFANLYSHVDEQGRPQGALPWDPHGHNPDRGWVGARLEAVQIKPARTVKVGNAVLTLEEAEYERTLVFDHEPTTLPETPYYLAALRRGELVAADEATAKMAGLKFVDPEKALADAKIAAITLWKQQAHEYHGGDVPEALTGALHGKALGDARAKAAKDAAAPKAPAADTKTAPAPAQNVSK